MSRRVLAFYYVWYGTPWGTGILQEWAGWSIYGYDPDKITQGRRESAITCFPLDGLYDSSSEYTIRRHLYQARQANIDGFIVSWWGFPERMGDTPEAWRHKSADASLKTLLELAPSGFDVSLYYETAQYGDRSVAQNIRQDLARIVADYGSMPAWLKVDGRPVVVIYGRVMSQLKSSCEDDIAEWQAIRDDLLRQGKDVFLVGDSLDPAYADVMDCLHTYNPIGLTVKGVDLGPLYQQAAGALHNAKKLFASTVVPGFDHDKVRWTDGQRILEPRRDGGYYIASWDTALSCRPDWILITSWNEWYEGSQIEPSVEYGHDYITLTRQQAGRFRQL